jgi:hypothetical protein
MKAFKGTTSLFSLHYILHQEAMYAESLKTAYVMDTAVKSVNFICANTLNCCKFVALLGQIESRLGKIIYHTNVRSLTHESVLQCFI